MLDCHRVRLYRESTRGISGLIRSIVLVLSRQRAVALGHHVFLPRHCSYDLAVLAHELTHCCQYEAWGPLRYFGRGAITQLRDLLYRWGKIGTSPYCYQIEPGKPFSSYGMEQQGQIVEDCFRGHRPAQAISPFWPGQVLPDAQGMPSA
jgi:hypothetical protein